MKHAAVLVFATLLCACALGPKPKPAPVLYDFGAPPAENIPERAISATVHVPMIAAPAWLDAPGIIYRLAYDDIGRQQNYANSRWAASPAELLTQRLRDRVAHASRGGAVSGIDGVHADYTLRVELEDFSQIFDAADRSRAVVSARVTLIDDERHTLVAQQSFTIEHAAATPNAEGGVHALTVAGDELVDAVAAWTVTAVGDARPAAVRRRR